MISPLCAMSMLRLHVSLNIKGGHANLKTLFDKEYIHIPVTLSEISKRSKQ